MIILLSLGLGGRLDMVVMIRGTIERARWARWRRAGVSGASATVFGVASWFALAGPVSGAATLVFRQGAEVLRSGAGTGVVYAGARDVELRAEAPDTNFDEGAAGEGDDFEATVDGREPHADGENSFDSHYVLRFEDVIGGGSARIPAGAAIHSATLTIHVSDPGNHPELHELAIDWDETTATWNNFGAGSDGVTAGVESMFVLSFNGYVLGSRNLDVTSTVRKWADGSLPNRGFAFLPSGDNGVDIDTIHNVEIAYRPSLTVSYSAVPEPGRALFGLLGLVAAGVVRRRRVAARE